MIDPSLLDIPSDAVPSELPILGDTTSFTRFLYLYWPYSQNPGFKVHLWWECLDGACMHRAYATGHLQLPLPQNLHNRVNTKIASDKLTRFEAARTVAEESWPETQAEFKQMLRDRKPAIDQECLIPKELFEEAIRLGTILKTAPYIEQPRESTDDSTMRILGKLEDGVMVDMMLYGGHYDISDVLCHLRQLSTSVLESPLLKPNGDLRAYEQTASPG